MLVPSRRSWARRPFLVVDGSEAVDRREVKSSQADGYRKLTGRLISDEKHPGRATGSLTPRSGSDGTAPPSGCGWELPHRGTRRNKCRLDGQHRPPRNSQDFNAGVIFLSPNSTILAATRCCEIPLVSWFSAMNCTRRVVASGSPRILSWRTGLSGLYCCRSKLGVTPTYCAHLRREEN